MLFYNMKYPHFKMSHKMILDNGFNCSAYIEAYLSLYVFQDCVVMNITQR